MVKSSWFSNIYTEAKGKMNRGYTVERELGRHTTGVSVPRVFTGRSGRRVYSTGPSRQWKTPTSFNLPKVRLHSQRRLRHHMAIGTWTTKVIRWVPAKLRTAESWCEYGIYVCCTHSLWVFQRLRTYLVFHLPPLLLLSSETESRVAFKWHASSQSRTLQICWDSAWLFVHWSAASVKEVTFGLSQPVATTLLTRCCLKILSPVPYHSDFPSIWDIKIQTVVAQSCADAAVHSLLAIQPQQNKPAENCLDWLGQLLST